MTKRPGDFVARIDDFGDCSNRELVTLTPEGQRDTETWLPLDLNGDVGRQHADLAARTYRLWKVRVRSYLNGLGQTAHWQEHVSELRRGVEATGYDAGQFFFAGCLSLVEGVDLHGHLSATCEAARVAGFVTDEEVGKLAHGESIEVVMDPRPEDVPPGPPIVGTLL